MTWAIPFFGSKHLRSILEKKPKGHKGKRKGKQKTQKQSRRGNRK